MTDKKELPKIKKPYDVKLEVLMPTTITYRVMALDPQDAVKEIEKNYGMQTATKQDRMRKIKIKATVYQASTSMIKHTKNYRNM